MTVRIKMNGMKSGMHSECAYTRIHVVSQCGCARL